jgi:hypothetical protein
LTGEQVKLGEWWEWDMGKTNLDAMEDLIFSRELISSAVESEARLCPLLQSGRLVLFKLSARDTIKDAEEGATMEYLNGWFVMVTKAHDQPANI